MKHGGTTNDQGALNRGTAPQPSPQHGGTSLPKGRVHAPQPQVYGTHGGTNLPRTLKKQK